MEHKDTLKIYLEGREKQRKCIQKLNDYIDAHKIKRGGCHIHGETGPVWYENITDHPKVRAKMGMQALGQR